MSINENLISHTSRNQTLFLADRADLRHGVCIFKPKLISQDDLAQDIAEFAAWHRGCIFDQLNGFQGYNNVRYYVQESKSHSDEVVPLFPFQTSVVVTDSGQVLPYTARSTPEECEKNATQFWGKEVWQKMKSNGARIARCKISILA